MHMHVFELIGERTVGFSNHAMQLPCRVAIALRPLVLSGSKLPASSIAAHCPIASEVERTTVTDHRGKPKRTVATGKEINPA